MADAGVVRDANRLPWLEPYRAPPRKKSNRRAGVTAFIGAVGLVSVVTLLLRDPSLIPANVDPLPQASVVLPAPEDLQPQVVLPPLRTETEPAAAVDDIEPARLVRPAKQPRRKIRAVPARTAYRAVMREQEPAEESSETIVTEAALAIASMPVTADPPRPIVNPAAQVVRGKTVQLGVFFTRSEAEAAWKSAIRDYTYLVTMPKSIEPIAIRSKRYYRLQLGTPSRTHARQLCSNLKSIGRACRVA